MVRVRGRTGASWRGMRLPQRLQEGLRQRHALRLHGWCIGSLILGVMWAVSHAQMALGVPSLALRYLVTLGVGYGVYLLVRAPMAPQLIRSPMYCGEITSRNSLAAGMPRRLISMSSWRAMRRPSSMR